eukprot:m.136686 g.136686  ORF g.136686 m.136686 type:complete len:540 (-) comp14734_c0_seq16:1647-3266(-)
MLAAATSQGLSMSHLSTIQEGEEDTSKGQDVPSSDKFIGLQTLDIGLMQRVAKGELSKEDAMRLQAARVSKVSSEVDAWSDEGEGEEDINKEKNNDASDDARMADPQWCYGVVYEYAGEPSHGELRLETGDSVTVLETSENGWYFGVSRTSGNTGWFPAGFVKHAPELFVENSHQSHEQNNETTTSEKSGRRRRGSVRPALFRRKTLRARKASLPQVPKMKDASFEDKLEMLKAEGKIIADVQTSVGHWIRDEDGQNNKNSTSDNDSGGDAYEPPEYAELISVRKRESLLAVVEEMNEEKQATQTTKFRRPTRPYSPKLEDTFSCVISDGELDRSESEDEKQDYAKEPIYVEPRRLKNHAQLKAKMLSEESNRTEPAPRPRAPSREVQKPEYAAVVPLNSVAPVPRERYKKPTRIPPPRRSISTPSTKTSVKPPKPTAQPRPSFSIGNSAGKDQKSTEPMSRRNSAPTRSVRPVVRQRAASTRESVPQSDPKGDHPVPRKRSEGSTLESENPLPAVKPRVSPKPAVLPKPKLAPKPKLK